MLVGIQNRPRDRGDFERLEYMAYESEIFFYLWQFQLVRLKCSAYKHFSCLYLAEVTSKNDSKLFKVAPVDGTGNQLHTRLLKNAS